MTEKALFQKESGSTYYGWYELSFKYYNLLAAFRCFTAAQYYSLSQRLLTRLHCVILFSTINYCDAH